MREHVAIVSPAIARALITRSKKIEVRLYRHRRVPFGRLWAGDQVHFKISGGRIIGTCDVAAAQHLHNLTPARVRAIQAVLGASVRASNEFWVRRLSARYAVLIWLGPLHPYRGLRPIPRQYGSGWVVLD